MGGYRYWSFDKQLASVILLLFILVILLSQPFPTVKPLARPLAIIFASLFIWLSVKQKSSMFIRLMGICFIIMLLFSTLLFWVPFSNEIVRIFGYVLIIFSLGEFTIQARFKTKVAICWLLFVPLFLTLFASQYFMNELWWVAFLAYPISWSFMAFTSEVNYFESTLKTVGLVSLGLLLTVFVAINILSLASISEFLEDENLKQIFSYSGSVPILQLAITLVFVPILVSWGVSFIIIKNRIKKLSYI